MCHQRPPRALPPKEEPPPNEDVLLRKRPVAPPLEEEAEIVLGLLRRNATSFEKEGRRVLRAPPVARLVVQCVRRSRVTNRGYLVCRRRKERSSQSCIAAVASVSPRCAGVLGVAGAAAAAPPLPLAAAGAELSTGLRHIGHVLWFSSQRVMHGAQNLWRHASSRCSWGSSSRQMAHACASRSEIASRATPAVSWLGGAWTVRRASRRLSLAWTSLNSRWRRCCTNQSPPKRRTKPPTTITAPQSIGGALNRSPFTMRALVSTASASPSPKRPCLKASARRSMTRASCVSSSPIARLCRPVVTNISRASITTRMKTPFPHASPTPHAS
mmetsp:Transcript_6501/g.21742  ORF Transcript_6501/g.21742 Transcript_6501/m.21742 type:complete len:328 (-) Transcript_6501:280-1263(-)